MSNKRPFLLGAMVLTASGMALYNNPYAVYAFLLVLSSAGLPTAISRMVSEHLVMGDRWGARTVFRKSRRILLVTGSVATVFMAALAVPIASAAGDVSSAPAFVALAPSLMFVCLVSAYRGYFQGMQRMLPTAASQTVEQVVKLFPGVLLATIGLREGGIVWGAVGAVAGVSLSELCALVLIMGAGARQARLDSDLPKGNAPVINIYKRLFSIAIPVTIGASLMPIVGLVDAFVIVNRLKDVGFMVEQARTMYGVFTGMVSSLINLPAVITVSLSISLVPAIASRVIKKDEAAVRAASLTGMRIAWLLSLPISVGMAMLARPILTMLFGGVPDWQLDSATQLLTIMSIGVLFLSLSQTTTGILQGLGKPFLPVMTLGIGLVAKIVLTYLLVGQSALLVNGAAIATSVCYVIAAIGNMWHVSRETGVHFAGVDFFLKPLIACAGMAVALWAFSLIGQNMSGSVYTLSAVGVGMAVYAVLLLVLRALKREDVTMLPKGDSLYRLLKRMKLMG